MDMKSVRSSVTKAGGKWGVLAVSFIALTGGAASLDNSFHPQINGAVATLALQSDGRIVIGGTFTSVNGAARSYLARLNADGSLDSSFAPASATFHFVRHIVVRDSKIYAAAGDGLRRFDAGGNVEWHYPISPLAFDVDSQQRVLVGGQFTRLENQFHRNLARLDANGALDASFAPSIGCCAGESVNALLAQGDAVLVGGLFQSANGEPASHLARINSDGARDSTFSGAADPPVVALRPGPDGKFLRVSRQFVTRHLGNGSVDPGFATLSAYSSDDQFVAAAIQADGRSVVGGNFTLNGDATRKYLLRLNSDGSIDPEFAIEPDDTVQSVAVAADGSLLIAGAFTTVNGTGATGLARITADTAETAPSCSLSIVPGSGPNIVLSWNATNGAVLESCPLNGNQWSAVSQAAVSINGRAFVTNATAGAGQLFRLRPR